MDRRCAGCAFWEPEDGEVGRCRYGAPRPTSEKAGHQNPPPVLFAVWPRVHFDDWCGRWLALLADKVGRATKEGP